MQANTLKIVLSSSLITALVMIVILVAMNLYGSGEIFGKESSQLNAACNDIASNEDYTVDTHEINSWHDKNPSNISSSANESFTNGYANQPANLNESAEAVDRTSLSEQEECSVECLKNLVEKITQGEAIDANALYISNNQAQLLALELTQQASLLNDLESSLAFTNVSEEREFLLFILSKLPKDSLFESAQRLSYSPSAQLRLAGLTLLEASLDENSFVAKEVTTLLQSESDVKVAVRAAEILEELAPSQVDDDTINTLTNLVNQAGDPKLQSAALLAKINLVKDDADVRADISRVLQSSEKTQIALGLQSLTKVLERQQYDETRGNWQGNDEFKNHVHSIANNNSADPSLRIEALQLLNRHYSD